MTKATTADRAASGQQRGRHRAERASDRTGVFSGHRDSALARGLLGTLPVLVAGTMTMGMAFTGPLAPTQGGKTPKPKDSTADLRQAIRDAIQRQAAVSPAVSGAEAVVTVASSPSTYTVKSGDTVSAIAARFGLSTASVLALNGLGWSSLIFPGQVLTLTAGAAPVTPTPAPPAPPATEASTTYTIVAGDTISAIAARFGVTTQAVLSVNGLGWSSLIFPGQSITIPLAPPPPSVAAPPAAAPEEPAADATPEPAPAPPPPVEYRYVITSGDTVSAIAARFGLSTQSVLTANGLGWSSLIFPGQSLIIPGVASTPAGSSSGVTPLTAEMADNARVIIEVGRSLGVPEYGIVIALATAMQESSLRNLDWGDRDSIGLFQQRPSQGWGSVEQIMNREFAALAFYGGATNPNKGKTRGLLDYAGWESMPLTVAAQTVQKSAYPSAYAKWESSARAWLAQLG